MHCVRYVRYLQEASWPLTEEGRVSTNITLNGYGGEETNAAGGALSTARDVMVRHAMRAAAVMIV